LECLNLSSDSRALDYGCARNITDSGNGKRCQQQIGNNAEPATYSRCVYSGLISN
jgi:hypothetical protein